MTQIINRLPLLVSLLLTSSQAGCDFRPYGNELDIIPTAVVSQIGHSKFRAGLDILVTARQISRNKENRTGSHVRLLEVLEEGD